MGQLGIRLGITLTCVLGFAGAVAAQSTFDGIYAGQMTMTGEHARTGASGFHCQNQPLRLTVKDGQFNWHVPTHSPSVVKVSADGSFSLGLGDYQLSGKVSAGRITADSQSVWCNYHIDLAKQS